MAESDNTSIETQGGGGELFSRPDNLRSDARMAARMLSLGVVSEERAAALLRKGVELAERCCESGDTRGYNATMKILLATGRMEQIERHESNSKSDALAPNLNIQNAQIILQVPDNGRRMDEVKQ